MLTEENQCWGSGIINLAGMDEAGRGPLAGPVVAVALIMSQRYAGRELSASLKGLTDSKQLSPLRREKFAAIIDAAAPDVQYGLGIAHVSEIDRINILQATHAAMRRALHNLSSLPEHVLVDGRPVPDLPCPSTALIKGDGRSLLIAAASVMAKVIRDRMMVELDRQYPVYGFARHKGYGCRAHVQALLEHGPCPAHRMTFRPVRNAADLIHRNNAGRRDELF